MKMAGTKIFIVGLVLGTIFGAAVFGAIFHLLLVGLIVAGSGTVVLGARRLVLGRRARKSLKA